MKMISMTCNKNGDTVALGDQVVRWIRKRTTLLPFHADWIKTSFAPDTQISALSVPRGNAKTWLFGWLGACSLTPNSPLWREGVEVLGVSASFEQSRVVMNFLRDSLEGNGELYRSLDSGQRLAYTHTRTGTKMRILSSSGKRAMGLSQFHTIFADEPGSWESRGGALMWDALRTSLGKLAQQRLLLIGTRSPAEDGGWWPNLLDAGSGNGTHVEVLTAPDDEPWDSWSTIRKVNPLVYVNENLRKTVLRERDDARRNPSLRPAFEAYRLNRQVDVHRDVLVPADTWRRVESREVPPREGRPILGLDLGSERSWSGAWALWANGRSECYALAPGVPDLDEREKQDGMPRGLYRRLHEDGVLLVDEGLRVSRPEVLINHLLTIGINPQKVLCDRFLLGALQDATDGRWPIVPRVTRWSEGTEDITGFRKLCEDGPLSIAPECRALARVSFSQASVKGDDQGSLRLEKKRHGRSRDDVAVAGTLAAGALVREMNRPKKPSWRYAGMVG